MVLPVHPGAAGAPTLARMPLPAAGTVLAVCVVHRVKPDAGRVGRTAIDKRPVDGSVEVGALGLAGDVQSDERDHGGVDQAVYAYDDAEAQRWAAQIGPVGHGQFGENLRTVGIAVTDAVIGERWAVGPQVELEVTLPRIPCATFGRHLGQERWVRRFAERGDVGAYLRVRTPGAVRAGDAVRRVAVPGHGVTVREAFRAVFGGPRDEERVRRLLDEADGLAPKLRLLLDRAPART